MVFSAAESTVPALRKGDKVKKQTLFFAALIAASGIVLLFVLIPKIWGILLILAGLVLAYTAYNQARHPEKGEVAEKAALINDRFHRARNQDNI